MVFCCDAPDILSGDWSRNGFRDDGRSGGVAKAGDPRAGELGPLRNGLLVGKLTVRPGDSRLSVHERQNSSSRVPQPLPSYVLGVIKCGLVIYAQ